MGGVKMSAGIAEVSCGKESGIIYIYVRTKEITADAGIAEPAATPTGEVSIICPGNLA